MFLRTFLKDDTETMNDGQTLTLLMMTDDVGVASLRIKLSNTVEAAVRIVYLMCLDSSQSISMSRFNVRSKSRRFLV